MLAKARNNIITDENLEAYNRDGVIHLPRLVNERWLSVIASGIGKNFQNPSPFFRDQTREGDPARYIFDYWTWRDIPEFKDFVEHGPLTAVATQILQTRSVTLLMDNWFMNEAGATNTAPWHQDKTYFDYDGKMCNILLALDKVPADQSLHFAKGSHKEDKTYKAINFRDKVPFEGQLDKTYKTISNVDQRYKVINWAIKPGDCLVFDLRTLHRGPNHGRPAPNICRRYSLRFGTPNTRFIPRGIWTETITKHIISMGQKPGEILNTPLTPQLTAFE